MKDRRKPREGLFQLKVLYNLFKRHKFAIRKHFLGYLLLGAYPDRNNFNNLEIYLHQISWIITQILNL